jgi:hypothetical protein
VFVCHSSAGEGNPKVRFVQPLEVAVSERRHDIDVIVDFLAACPPSAGTSQSRRSLTGHVIER